MRGSSLRKAPATRPTSDRVREALFSILGPIDDVRVLDLFAGSGALGLEALSRGAERAVFVESDRAAVLAIERNVAKLDLPGATVVRAEVAPVPRNDAGDVRPRLPRSSVRIG